jgi:hypothetical protein
MTKPITGVAVLILYEEGKFFLTDPVSKYLPELANMKVAVVETDPESVRKRRYTVPAKREITILDLMRHTSGIDYRGPDDADGKPIYEKLGTNALNQPIGDMVRRLVRRRWFISPARCGVRSTRSMCLPDWLSGFRYDTTSFYRAILNRWVWSIPAHGAAGKASGFRALCTR